MKRHRKGIALVGGGGGNFLQYPSFMDTKNRTLNKIKKTALPTTIIGNAVPVPKTQKMASVRAEFLEQLFLFSVPCSKNEDYLFIVFTFVCPAR